MTVWSLKEISLLRTHEAVESNENANLHSSADKEDKEDKEIWR
jgi:hypothetical protein